MRDHYFISYSRMDGEEFALRLADKLESGPPPYSVWVDQRDIQPGRKDWDDQLVNAIKTCHGLLFVMSVDSVQAGSACKEEWVWALTYKKPVIPVRLHASAQLPFRLTSRQVVDFSQSFDQGLAKLRDHLAWTTSPEGVLQELDNRLADAKRELPRTGPEHHLRIEEEIAELSRMIAGQRPLVEDPEAVREETEARIAGAIERERQPVRSFAAARTAKFVNPPPMAAPRYFQDRYLETQRIVDFLRVDGLRLMSVIGRGGIGKTAMVCRLLKGLEAGRLPDDLGDLHVAGIVYLSPTGTHAVNFPNLFTDLCRLLSPEAADRLLRSYRSSNETADSLMRALLDALPAGPTVVLLDNFEDVVDETLAIADRALDEALRAVLNAPEHGLKVILTSRISPRSLILAGSAVQQSLHVDTGLASPYAEQFLRAMDPSGSLGLRDAAEPLLAKARERTRGLPRALEALAAIVAADRDTTLPELVADPQRMPENVVEALVGEAFNRLDPVAQQVMQALAVYVMPVPPVAIDYLLQPYQPATNSARVLMRLVNMHLVRRDASRYYLHQVDRDYALQRIPPGLPTDRDADPLPFTQVALRSRGATYFQETRTPRATWRNLDDLTAQLAEFELRCQAADYDTAAQILDDINQSCLILWGHYRLALELHQRLEGRLTDLWTEATCTRGLARCYDRLGEVSASMECNQRALAIARELDDRHGEATALGDLGSCYATLGMIPQAIELHEQSLAIARDLRWQDAEAADLANLALRHAELGKIGEAIDLAGQALAIAREIDDREGEAIQLGNLGTRYAALGETERAIELHQQALAIAAELGDRRVRSIILAQLGRDHADFGAWAPAIKLCSEAVDIADEIGLAQGRGQGGLVLATVYLEAGDSGAARDAATAARNSDWGPIRAGASLVLGIALIREGQVDGAKRAFRDALLSAEVRLSYTNDNYAALEAKALALCGLALVEDAGRLAEASTALSAVRPFMPAAGIVRRALRLFDALAAGDEAAVLEPIRPVVVGEGA